MIVKAVKTRIVKAGELDLLGFLDESIKDLKENTVVAVTSKVVGICEGRVIPISGSVDRNELVRQEADFYLPASLSKYDFSFTITHGTLVPVSGIDESNGNGNYVLWPKNPPASANKIRTHLRQKFGLKNLGVVITDSTARPLHYGTEGVCIAFSGFSAMNDYKGKPDLFGRPFKVSISNVADGLASSAVLVMGEGTEQTPIAIVENIPFTQFQDHDPTAAELNAFYISIKEDDLFAPFLTNVEWIPGKNKSIRDIGQD